MTLTSEEVIWGYTCFRGRAPESEAVVVGHMAHYATFADLRMQFARSGDFKALIGQPENCYIAPFLLPDEVDGTISIKVPELANPQ